MAGDSPVTGLYTNKIDLICILTEVIKSPACECSFGDCGDDFSNFTG